LAQTSKRKIFAKPGVFSFGTNKKRRLVFYVTTYIVGFK
jgi:hypothetical protein